MDPTATNFCVLQPDLHDELCGEPEEQVASQGATSTDSCSVADEPSLSAHTFAPAQPAARRTRARRRRPVEIDRLYKCGWNGCLRAYGTIGNLNTHVSVKGHGAKRTLDGQPSSTLLHTSCSSSPSIVTCC